MEARKSLAPLIVGLILVLIGSSMGGNVQTIEDDTVLAEVNGEIITKEDLREFASQISSSTKNGDSEKLLQSLILRKLLLQEAKRRKLDQDEKVRRRIEVFKESILIETVMRSELEKIKITDGEAKDYYELHQEEFGGGERVKARHIVIKDERKAEEILKRLKSGTDFAEMAKKESIGSDREKGGDLGFLSKGDYIPTIGFEPKVEEAIFSLNEGEISGLIRTKTRIHIVKVEEKKDGEPKEFSEVEDQIRKKLLEGKLLRGLEDYLERLRGRGSVIVYEERLHEEGGSVQSTDELLREDLNLDLEIKGDSEESGEND